MRYYISPSKLARYFYHDCERQLLASASGDLPGIAPEGMEKDTSLVMELLQDSGYDWEERVLEHHLKEARVHIAPGDGRLSERFFSQLQFLEMLPNLKDGDWVYQPTLKVSLDFHERYGLDPELIHFPACRPDLLRFRNGKFEIVDVKASDALKASHRVQVAFYALVLEDILPNQQEGVNNEDGYIWLYECNEPESFELAPSLRVLKNFFSDKLQTVLQQPYQKAFWHLSSRCEWCDLFQSCQKEALEQQNVSLVPGLTHGSRRFLRDQLEVDTLSELEKVVKRGDAESKLKNCGSLSGRARRLRNSVNALTRKTCIQQGGGTMRLPIREDVRLILTVQKEPVSGRIYAAGFQRLGGQAAYGDGQSSYVEVAASPQECENVRVNFLEALYQELYQLHKYNESKAWKEQKSLQIYTFDASDHRLFEEMIFAHLQSQQHTRQAMQLMLYFQSEKVAESKVHPVQEVSHPVVPVQNLLQEVLALPEPVAFQLQSALKHLLGESSRYPVNERFHYRFNAALRAGPVLKIWESGTPRGKASIQRELIRRMQGTGDLLMALREAVGEHLFAWPRKFVFPRFRPFQEPKLSRLSFVIRYESLQRALEVREARAKPYLERLHQGTTISLRKEEGNNWTVLSALDASQFDDHGGFKSFLLSTTCSEGTRKQMAFDDFRYRSWFSVKSDFVWVVGVKEVQVDGSSGLITAMVLSADPDLLEQPPGVRFHLHPRFTDFTSDRQIDALAGWDENPNSLLIQLLKTPHQIGPVDDKAALPSPTGLTPSQLEAFHRMWSHQLTLVWGPPGTGKTHFIATAVDQILRHRSSFRVAVTAFTHAAVENVLRKLMSLSPEYMVKKLGEIRKEDSGLTSQPLKGLAFLPERFVLGATVYRFEKAQKKSFPKVDLLIVDEGSQMKWGELSLALGILKKGGRLLLAGDDLQLPPILSGEYPVEEPGRPGLEDSVFAYLRARDDKEQPFTRQLTESWRMNAVLNRFSADTLYGHCYGPANSQIASQRLRLGPGDHPLNPLLDPDYPLVIAILEDVSASKENIVEAELVAQLCCQLRERMPKVLDDRTFWKEQLFVVSPHHLQIRAILAQLAARRHWTSPPFVDTVDKMQGQEAECVVVSYGVSDQETALQEAEFIYSMNRLNVSVTRARSKCIVFLPRPLLNPTFDLLSSDKAASGLGHMMALLDYCKEHGECLKMDIGQKMTVWRA
jgi:DNA replication ATP-dependent helicase/nuclease Dna2